MLDRKTVLYFALIAILVLLWSAWQRDYPKPSPQAVTQPATGTIAPVSLAEKTAEKQEIIVPSSRLIEVKTDVFTVKIDKKGGNIVKLLLPKYPKSYETPNDPVQLLTDSPDKYYAAESGLVGTNGPDSEKEQAVYTVGSDSYILPYDKQQLNVELHWKNAAGLNVVKTFTFKRGKYDIDVQYRIDNKSSQTWMGKMFAHIKRRGVNEDEGGVFGLRTYTGAAISSAASPYEKISYKKMDSENLDRIIKGGWVAMQQRYFVTAWIPTQNLENRYYSAMSPIGPSNKSEDKIYTIGFVSPPISLTSGGNTSIGSVFYAGPEIADALQRVAPHLDLVIDYGWLWIFSIPIFKVMQVIYQFIGNWGWAIVIVTILIKLLFYKLSETSYRSMAKMRDIQPRLLALKERYGEDKQKLSQATMELYRKEKINPLGGCLPILIQIPVFIALYYVLIESVELRQAPFIFWIHDLSVKDPYYVLPILMGISWLLQQKLNPPPPDPMQAKLMMALPIVFTVLFATFPAGLVLYWLVNNVISIIQQWYIMRKFERDKTKKKPKK